MLLSFVLAGAVGHNCKVIVIALTNGNIVHLLGQKKPLVVARIPPKKSEKKIKRFVQIQGQLQKLNTHQQVNLRHLVGEYDSSPSEASLFSCCIQFLNFVILSLCMNGFYAFSGL